MVVGESIVYRFLGDGSSYDPAPEGIVEIYIGDVRVASIDAEGKEHITVPENDRKYAIVKNKLEEYKELFNGQALKFMNHELEQLKAEILFLLKGLEMGPLKIEVETNVDREYIESIFERVIKPYVNARVNVMQNSIKQLRSIYAKSIKEKIDKEREKIIIATMTLIDAGFKVVKKNGKWYYYYPGKIVPNRVIVGGAIYELKNDDEYYYIKGLYVPISGTLRTGSTVMVDDARHINVNNNYVCVGTMDGLPITPENVVQLFEMLYTMNDNSAYFHVERDRVGDKIQDLRR